MAVFASLNFSLNYNFCHQKFSCYNLVWLKFVNGMKTMKVELCRVMDLVNINKYLIEGCKERAARLFSVISSE